MARLAETERDALGDWRESDGEAEPLRDCKAAAEAARDGEAETEAEAEAAREREALALRPATNY